MAKLNIPFIPTHLLSATLRGVTLDGVQVMAVFTDGATRLYQAHEVEAGKVPEWRAMRDTGAPIPAMSQLQSMEEVEIQRNRKDISKAKLVRILGCDTLYYELGEDGSIDAQFNAPLNGPTNGMHVVLDPDADEQDDDDRDAAIVEDIAAESELVAGIDVPETEVDELRADVGLPPLNSVQAAAEHATQAIADEAANIVRAAADEVLARLAPSGTQPPPIANPTPSTGALSTPTTPEQPPARKGRPGSVQHMTAEELRAELSAKIPADKLPDLLNAKLSKLQEMVRKARNGKRDFTPVRAVRSSRIDWSVIDAKTVKLACRNIAKEKDAPTSKHYIAIGDAKVAAKHFFEVAYRAAAGETLDAAYLEKYLGNWSSQETKRLAKFVEQFDLKVLGL